VGRAIVVGDVHGCADELSRLLELVRFQGGDQLYFVGDLLSRGPHPEQVLQLFRSAQARGVRGNHEETLLKWHRAHREPARGEVRLGRSHQKLAHRLTGEDWALLESLDLWIDLPDHGLRIVHAGVIPGIPIEEQPHEALLSMRYLGPHNEPIEKGGTVLWGSRYVGPPHVVFGHNAQPEPQLHPWATGLDTAAVYGGHLSAMVLDEGQEVPALEERKSVLFSVRSSEAYYTP
jgi:hypothetical protein